MLHALYAVFACSPEPAVDGEEDCSFDQKTLPDLFGKAEYSLRMFLQRAV